MIRDTSAQDRPLAKPGLARPGRRWVARVLVAVAVVAGLGYVLRGWLGAARSIERARIRIARGERGTLVRDVVADGRVVAADNPTLYAVAAGTVAPAADVRLHVRRLPSAVSIEVSDRGAGMTEAVLSNALLPFYSTKRGGTGLGLALVREIAEAHGGRVSLANRQGGGVSVTLTIPQ